MDDLFIKTPSRWEEPPEDAYAEGSAKRHRSKVQRLKSSELGASPRSPVSPSGQRGRGRPPKVPRLEISSPSAVRVCQSRFSCYCKPQMADTTPCTCFANAYER